MYPKQSLDATKDIEGGDFDNIRGVLEHAKIPRPITPIGFVREAGKHTPTTPKIPEAMKSKDKADLESQYPFGHRLMTKQGWLDQSGLGPDGSGIQRPIGADILARNLTEGEYPAGLGYKPKTNGISLAHRNHGQKVTAWYQDAADPHIGAKTVCRDHDAADGAGQIKVAHPIAALTSANSKTIIQDRYIIYDNWKVTPTHRNTPRARDNASHRILGKMAKEPSEKTSVFVPHSDDSSFKGW